MRPAPKPTHHSADLSKKCTRLTLITAMFTALSMAAPSWPQQPQGGPPKATLNGAIATSSPAAPTPTGAPQPTTDPMPGMSGMSGHMYLTPARPAQPGDQSKADAIVAAAKTAMAPYQDYHQAEADGYQIFLPNVPQPLYHFTNYKQGWAARTGFDPLKPTSLLYQKTADGGYKLIGAMYTDRVDAPEDELNDRIPLSIAHWHQHVNFCKAPAGQASAYFGPNAKFGLMGSISTREACEAAGGKFLPHVFGWMVHVYPYETDPKDIWSTSDDHASGHDNMSHSAMPGMKME
jgi:hypothetical protein